MSNIDSAESGTVEAAVTEALRAYPALSGMQAPLASMAVRLARAYDQSEGTDLTKLARLNQELRQTLQVISEVGLDDSDPADGLPTPVRDTADRPADVGTGGSGGGPPAR